MKLIDKSALVAEIERQQRRCDILHQSNDVESRKTAAIQNGVYCYILSFLNTLEVKEVDFETAFAASIDHFDEKNNYGQWPESDLREFAEHFFELGLKMKQKEVDLEEVLKEYFKGWEVNEDLGLVKPDGWSCIVKDLYTVAKHFFELGLKAQKGE